MQTTARGRAAHTGTGRRTQAQRNAAFERAVWRGQKRKKRQAQRLAVNILCMAIILLLTSALLYGVFSLLTPEAGEGAGLGSARPAAAGTGTGNTVPVVVLDAGHGGNDNGATNAEETIFEADITLDMALRVGALLARHEGLVEVVYTRTDRGEYISPRQRGEISGSVGADLLVSLHVNADELYPSTNGFQVFAQPTSLAHNEGSLRLAQAMVDRVGATGLSLLGDTGIYYMFYRDAYDKMGYDISWPVPPTELMNDTFGVLQYASCPAVLAEMWYISNASDMAKMYNETGRDAMAAALYGAICEYLDIAPV